MKLKELLEGVKIEKCFLDLNIEISNVVSDSRKVSRNDAFIALEGMLNDGNKYIEEVIKKGAVCIITQKKELDYNNAIIVNDVRLAMSIIYRNYYQNPSKDMKIIAITGTNGKTSTAYFLYSILRNAKKSTGLISTIKCLINDENYKMLNGGSDIVDSGAAMTTPDPGILFKTLSDMKQSGVEYVVMEASSHSLELKKIDALNINTGIFTNLSHDHLDFHKNIDNYFKSKMKLFDLSENSIINVDDIYGEIIATKHKDSIKFSTRKNDSSYSEKIKISSTGCNFYHVYKDKKLKIKAKILGLYTVYNASLAITASRFLGIKSKYIKKGIAKCNIIEGRLEKIKENIFIDFAHTPSAMESVISYFRKIAPNKKIKILFGCGGNRDNSKRTQMGKIASTLADYIIITTDNSRKEEPLVIVNDIKKGITENANYCIILDRREAIIYAVKTLKKDEILLLLGKGHEEYEILGDEKKHFSEKEIIFEALSNGKNH